MNTTVAAFFDLDGTLLPEPSLERRLFSSLRKSRAIPHANYLFWAMESLRLLPSGLLAVQHGNKRYLSGLNVDFAVHLFDSLTFFEEGIARVAWHARQAHQIVLVSGTLEPLAQLAAVALECELEARGLQVHLLALATELEVVRGHWTGRLAHPALYGPAKAHAVVERALSRRWSLPECHAYGDSILDAALLSAVGHGHAVNPASDLAAIANREDWPIWHWRLEKRIAPRANCVSEIQSLERQA